MSQQPRAIVVKEAYTNNLKGVTCAIPHGSLTVVTGVSGSGKSSLAFDTVYAEGQRRYVETLSTYVRQFLQQMRKPPVLAVENLQPSLAIRQHNPISNARATVGTITELDHYLQTLFSGVGVVQCYRCSETVRSWNPTDVISWLRENAAGERIIVVAEQEPEEDSSMATLLEQVGADGFRRLWVGDSIVDIQSDEALRALDRPALHVVIDRLSVSDDDARLFEAIEGAMDRGNRVAMVLLWDRRDAEGTPAVRRFETGWRCSVCGAEHHEPVPALLSPDSGMVSCEDCNGYGRRAGIDMDRVIPDPSLSIEKKVFAAFRTPKMSKHHRDLASAAVRLGIPVDVPWSTLREEDRERLLYGDGSFLGAISLLEDLRKNYRYKLSVASLLARFTGYVHCSTCAGSGLGKVARAVRIGDKHIGEVQDLRLEELAKWVDQIPIRDDQRAAMDALLRELRARVDFLNRTGAGYLTLSRRGRTLSGGELHRVVLATSLGRGLTDTCYVLDEPTAGLHPKDTERLIEVMEELRDLGNTVLVVEHDPDVMLRAQHLIELGPYGGESGGELLFEGDYEGLMASDSPTGEWIRAHADRALPAEFIPEHGFLAVEGARLHNLKNVHVRFAKGALNVVTGLSGSGKSTLVHDVLYNAMMRARGVADFELDPGDVTIHGDDFDELVLVDQDAIPSFSRSCALTLTDAYSPVRDLFANTDAARAQGLSAGHFSFNVATGRCPRCDGSGTLTIEMHFIADVELPCDVCDGKRFQPNILAIKWRGLTISDVFNLTVDQALEAFDREDRITQRLAPLREVGLGYLRLGQSVSQLSGGEKQRLKLATYLGHMSAKERDKRRLFIFDEPSVGLHMRDVDVLLRAIRRLTRDGHTVIVVEHNTDVIAAADWAVDLGPGAGPRGGELVYEGPLRGMIDAGERSNTAPCVRSLFRV